jgi:carbon-monoxide dehydrogenase small subunit
MIAVNLTVNGTLIDADVEPRQSLADFLREQRLLTGTHLGCEHGVCGACNVLIDGEPARSCITLAGVCGGCDIRTIEGLEDDPIMSALRAAFTAEHALQCGYCTPGMLVTARDIVRRLPDADDARIRLELAGNLCRCTGYMGIVRAIRRVLDARLDLAAQVRAPVPAGRFEPANADAPTIDRAAPVAAQTGGGERLTQTLRLALPRDVVWYAVRDPALIASCVPGARLASVDDGRIAGDLLASLGPIQARFAGTATVTYDDATWSGRIAASGSDPASGSRLNAEAGFRIDADGPQSSTITLDVAYALRGTLAQLGRGPIVRAFAAEVAANVGRNLEARLRGEARAAPQRLRGGTLILRAIWRWLRGLLSRRHD